MIPPFFHVRCVEETTSTNDDASRAAQAGAAQGLVIQALSQNAGKGRQGRAWSSPQGNLYLSVLLRPDCSLQEASLYSFVAALAVYDTVATVLNEKSPFLSVSSPTSRAEALLGEGGRRSGTQGNKQPSESPSPLGPRFRPPSLCYGAARGDDTREKMSHITHKWPNDVLVNDKKISGILLESAPALNGRVDWLVMGVGINVASHPQNASYLTTCLAQEGAEKLVLKALLETFLEKLDTWRLILIKEGFENIRQAWIARARQGKIKARLAHETISGEFAGLDENGHLMITLKDGSIKNISAADVFFT